MVLIVVIPGLESVQQKYFRKGCEYMQASGMNNLEVSALKSELNETNLIDVYSAELMTCYKHSPKFDHILLLLLLLL